MTRRLFYTLRTEGVGRGRDAAALGVGAFIGCLPFYGFHLLLVAVFGRLLGLNRIRMYAAANISNPFMAPALMFLEVQTGAWLRRRVFHPLTIEALQAMNVWTFAGDLLLGSLVVGAVIGSGIALATRAAVAHARPLPPHIERTFALAADRFFALSITAWEFARGKLRRDPIYGAALEDALPGKHTLVDIGCGQGLTLAVLAEARAAFAQGHWPPDAMAPPVFDRMIGIETRARVARMARAALGADAEILHATAPDGLPPTISVVLLFDVLHLMGADDQERLVAAVFERLEPGGIALVREVDASGGWGFQAVRLGNRVKNLVVGRWRQAFHFRSEAAWRDVFTRAGWRVDARPMSEGTPFANVLFRLVKPASPRTDQQDPPGARQPRPS